MKGICKIVRDLLPLYQDGVCSEESKQMVEEHISCCEDCKKELQMMNETINASHPQIKDEAIIEAASTAWKKGKKKAFRKGAIIALIVVVVLLGSIVGGYLYIRNQPVAWDAGACGGGYSTFIFDKYCEELTQKFVNGMEDSSNISSVRAVRGTQEAEWEDQTIYLQFDIQYEHSTQGTLTEKVRFIGHRTWIDTYDWSGAIIRPYTLEVMESTVAEVGRGLLNLPVEVTKEDADALSKIINSGSWIEEPTEYDRDCVINLKGHWMYYDSNSGILNKYDLSGMSYYSSIVQEVKGESLVVSETDRVTINSILQKYITLGPENHSTVPIIE